MGPLELLDGEAQLARTTWTRADLAARKETAASSLVTPPLPLPAVPPEGAVGDGDPVVGVGLDDGLVCVGVGDALVGDGLGDVVEVGADEHEADGAACLALAAGLVEAWCVG